MILHNYINNLRITLFSYINYHDHLFDEVNAHGNGIHDLNIY